MNRCPITYQLSQEKYSSQGLAKLSRKLLNIADLPYTTQELRREAARRTYKMSIQGVQPKLSAKLRIKNNAFEIVDNKGTYIIKPQNDLFRELPENEDLTMKMAEICGIEVPLTGLVYSKDQSLNYFIKRFDRYSRNKKKHVEDFAQLTDNTRDTKYNWSMEKLIPVIEKNCTFPMIEKRKLLNRTLFCFLTGNEDMHLKNFSLMSFENKITLTPAYDLLSTTIAMGNVVEEIALPIAGKKSSLERTEIIEYYGKERLKLNGKTIENILSNLSGKKEELVDLIKISFLSTEMKEKYKELLLSRFDRLEKPTI